MKIVAIGGGHLGNHENEPYDMFEIDKEIVSLSGKAHPRLLFICFNLRSNYYYGFLKRIYANLGAQCERLGYEKNLKIKRRLMESLKEQTYCICVVGIPLNT